MPSHANSRSQRATLTTVAAELGVSPTTVSNAYNRPDQLAPATRERILAAAERLGYAGPDPTARSLRIRRAGSTGVLLTEHLTYAFEDQASVDFLAGMAEASAEDDSSTLTLIPAGPQGENLGGIGIVARTSVDGFVVYSVAENDPYLEATLGRGLPLVICDQPKGTGLPFVGIEDRAAIAPAAQLLADAGHTHIAILAIRLFRARRDGEIDRECVSRADMHVQRDRVLGALDVFDAARISDVHIFTRHINTADSAHRAATEILSSHPQVTAILCTTDTMALGVLAAARDLGVAVPEQLSVTGFDGIGPALLRGLSTVVQPNKEKGKAAGQLLARLIAAEGQDGQENAGGLAIFLDTQLSVGSTVAAPGLR